MLRQDQHVDSDEAQEIIRLAAREQNRSVNEGPTIDGLAEALNLEPSEVERLLGEVRRRKAQQQAPQHVAQPQRQFGDRSAALSAGIVLALVLTIGVIAVGGFLMFGKMSVETTAPPMPPAVIVGAPEVSVNPSDVAIARDAPPASIAGSPVPAEVSSSDVDVLKERIEEARKALEQAQGAYEQQSKSINEEDRVQAQQRLDEAKEALKALEDKLATSGR